MSDSLIGQTIDGYRIEEIIGRGGMGTVYKAVDEALDKTVALKVISPHLAEDDTFLKRFRAEAKALARLDAPGIVRVLTLRETERGVFIVMEYVEGETLSTLVRRHAPIDWDRALPLFREILQAIHHAHASGVLHRDLKPSNILVTEDGQVKMTDFGLAKIQTSDADLTTTFETAGTIYYMSPEQIKGLRHVDERSDLFALGMICYEVLTGRLPVDKTGSNYAIQHAIVEQPLPPPTAFASDLPEPLADWLMTMLAKDPAHRFQSAADALDALNALAPVAEQAPPPADSFSPPEDAPSNRTRIATLTGFALAALMLLGGAFWTVQYVLNLPTSASEPPANAILTLSTSPPGATVFIDGDSVGQAPLRQPVPHDTLTLRTRLAGFAPIDTTLAVSGDQQLALTLTPSPMAVNAPDDDHIAPADETAPPQDDPPPNDDAPPASSAEDVDAPSDQAGPSPARSSLALTSTPDSATVVLNGTFVGTTPLTLDTLSGDTYRLAFGKDQRQNYTTTVRVQPGQTTRVNATLPLQPAVLTLRVIPYGDILINDSLRAQQIETAFVDTLAPGSHRVTARYRSMEWTQTVTLTPGQARQQEIDFTETVGVPITAQTVDGNPLPNAEIVVDSTAQGYTPQQLQLRVGQHTITVQKDGFIPATRTINVNPGEQETLVFQLRPRS